MNKILKVILIVIGSIVVTVIIAVITSITFLGGGLHSNAAADTFKPIDSQIKSLGGTLICTNGDSGYGIDNAIPWHSAYYSISDSKNLTQQIKDITSSANYPLSSDTQRVDNLQSGNNIGYPNVEEYNQKNDYLTSTKGKLSIEIIRSGQIALNCDTGKYGTPKSPEPNTAIVFFNLSLPSTH